MQKVVVLLGSNRPGRNGIKVANWFMDVASQRTDFSFEFVDVADLDLPIYNEPEHPMSGNYKYDYTKNWSRKAAQADAFVIVTPEYNHGYPAALKNALDYLYYELQHKPIGFVGYGSDAGIRAIEQLRQVAINFQMAPVSTTQHVGFKIFEQVNKDGELQATERDANAAHKMLDELHWWSTALTEARAKTAAQ